jgi:hypothetical protein
MTDTNEDGWIPWNGGECPVEPDTAVRVRYLNGFDSILGVSPSVVAWDHLDFPFNATNVVAYQVRPS